MSRQLGAAATLGAYAAGLVIAFVVAYAIGAAVEPLSALPH